MPSLIVGTARNAALLQTWVKRVAANDNVGQTNDFNARSFRNQSFANGVRRFGNFVSYAAGTGPDDRLVDDTANANQKMPMESALVNRVILGFVGGLLTLLAATALRSVATPSGTGWLVLASLGAAATVVVSPLSWGHHYVMVAPALLFMPAWCLLQEKPSWAKAFAWSAAALLFVHYAAIDYAGRTGLLGIGMMVWTSAATSFVCIKCRTSKPVAGRDCDDVPLISQQSYIVLPRSRRVA